MTRHTSGVGLSVGEEIANEPVAYASCCVIPKPWDAILRRKCDAMSACDMVFLVMIEKQRKIEREKMSRVGAVKGRFQGSLINSSL